MTIWVPPRQCSLAQISVRKRTPFTPDEHEPNVQPELPRVQATRVAHLATIGETQRLP